MKTQILLTLVTFLFSFAAQAQEKRCGFTHKPNLQQEQIIKQLISQKAQNNTRTEEKTYTIPVLFHIIQTNNPNDEVNKLTSIQIKEQIKILNNDYNRLNADTVRTPEIFKNVTGKISINFVLAKIDSNGVVLKEEGIVRHTKFGKIEWQLADFETEVKPQTIRNPYKYLNIWVVNNLNGGLGFAQFPDFSALQGLANTGGLAETDGVIIGAATFNIIEQRYTIINPNFYNYGFGRTLTHELGHFFGLLHTFSDARGSCEDNDFCEDTPRLKNKTSGCFTSATLKCEAIAMPENFLDYTNDACMNLFTKCQVERMKVVLEKCPRRKELANSTVTSAREENLAANVSIFPNPTNTFFTIKTENLQIKNLKIFSILGQQVYQNADIQANTSIDIAHLPKAMYVLQIETAKGMAIKKLVVVD
jgi:zinc-dependent metalloproteinase lipoprotein